MRICYVCGNEAPMPPCQSDYCLELRARPEPSMPVFLSVPGGATSNVDQYRDMEKGMNQYASARKAGLQPASLKKGSVDKEEQAIESQQRAVDKLSSDNDLSGIKVKPGVEK